MHVNVFLTLKYPPKWDNLEKQVPHSNDASSIFLRLKLRYEKFLIVLSFYAGKVSKFRHLKGTPGHKSTQVENIKNISRQISGECNGFYGKNMYYFVKQNHFKVLSLVIFFLEFL